MTRYCDDLQDPLTRRDRRLQGVATRRSFLAQAARQAPRIGLVCAMALLVTSLGIGTGYAAGSSQSGGGAWSTGAPAPEEAGAATVPARGDLEAQLQDARRRLERDARDVAMLAAQLGTRAMAGNLRASNEARARGEVYWADRNANLAWRRGRRGVVGLRLDPASGRDGARVLEVSPGGPAQDAGIRPGDVIVAVNGAPISGNDTARQAIRRLMSVRPNSPVKVRVMRHGKPQALELTARPLFVFAFTGPAGWGAGLPMPPALPAAPALLARPDAPGPIAGLPPNPRLPDLPYFQALSAETAGMELVALTPTLGSYFGTDKGVLVLRAPADDAFRLEDGDVIVSIGGREPRNGAHATRILGSYGPGEHLVMKIVRHRKPMDLAITLPGHAPR